MLRRKKANKQYKRKLTNRSPTRAFSNADLFSPMAKKRIHDNEEDEDLLSPDERTSPDMRGDDTTRVDETRYESEEEDKERYVINVRHLKPMAAFSREYETLSMDDVLPSEKQRQVEKQEQEEIRQLRETRLPMKFRITQIDQDRSVTQTTTRYTQSRAATSLAFQNNATVQKIRKHKLNVKTFETNLSKKTSGSIARTSLARSSTTKHISGKKKSHANIVRFNPGNDDDYLPPGKENDFFEVLKMMNKPFKNEEEFEDLETNKKKLKEFKYDDEYKSCRRKDLKNNKIGTNNWSGLSVLTASGRNFAIEKVKMAFNNQDFDIWRKGVVGVLHAGRRQVRAFIETSFFNNVILLSVFLNTLILASQNLVTSTSGTDLLTTFNLVFTIIFTIEMGLKLIALGPVGYGRDPMNLFDCLIVILSLFDQISSASSGSSSGGGGKKAVSAFRTVRLFRTFRVLRVTKLLRSLAYMKVIIGVVSRSVSKFIFILILLLLFIFIFSLLGMQIYGGKLSSSADQGGLRETYNSFFDAFISVFQIMTQENWNDFMTISIRSPEINTYVSLLYLISWMCMGNYVFLNLFLAILLDEFTGEETEEELEEIEEENEEAEESSSIGGRTSSKTTIGGFESTKRGTTQKTMSKDSLKPIQSFDSKLDLDASEDEEKSSAQKARQHIDGIACRRSLYIFTKRNPIRAGCLWITRHRYFERSVLTMIAISSLKLSIDTFFSSDSYTSVSNVIDKMINIFFTLEAITKVISLGFVMDDGSYTRDSWNILDFIIVITSLIDMSFSNVNLSVIKILRLLRTLRPLRVVSHNPSMRLIVTALLESLKPMMNVLIVICLVWLMFAILAVNIVGEKLGYCNMTDSTASYYGISETDCPKYGVWTNPNVNFDNVFTAMLSLFIMSTMENWPAVMFSVADANDATDGPKEDGNKLFAGFYFIIFILIGSFFLTPLLSFKNFIMKNLFFHFAHSKIIIFTEIFLKTLHFSTFNGFRMMGKKS